MPICALCKSEVDKLINSHLIPKAAYRPLRVNKNSSGSSPFTIHPKKRTFIQTDRQVAHDLLCTSCEQLFSRNGEKIMGTLWATQKNFQLLERLNDAEVLLDNPPKSFYSPLFLTETERNGLIYFCISILWRANV